MDLAETGTAAATGGEAAFGAAGRCSETAFGLAAVLAGSLAKFARDLLPPMWRAEPDSARFGCFLTLAEESFAAFGLPAPLEATGEDDFAAADRNPATDDRGDFSADSFDWSGALRAVVCPKAVAEEGFRGVDLPEGVDDFATLGLAVLALPVFFSSASGFVRDAFLTRDAESVPSVFSGEEALTPACLFRPLAADFEPTGGRWSRGAGAGLAAEAASVFPIADTN